ncbi:MAG: DNA recombination protein RmuC, partial [Actinomycetota bacterium]|nr:DNA recombination protein RmuC [Actinomycetota bacterium]
MDGTAIVVMLVVGAVAACVAVSFAGLRRTLEARLGATDAELRRLGDAGTWREQGDTEMRREVAAFRTALETLSVREEERRVREEQGWSVLHKVAAVLSGARGAGQTGENIVRDALVHLPPSMLDLNFRVNGRVVEFGLVLPDGRRLPVDSKWSAERELQLLAEARDAAERERMVRTIERAVADRAKEVAAYLDPSLTASVGVAAVPDAAYAVLRRAHADAYRHGVLVISYSMALPVVLFLHSLVSRFASVRDVEACLTDLAGVLNAVESTLENKVARASSMLVNGTEELRGQVGKARATLARGRQHEEVTEPLPASLRVVG